MISYSEIEALLEGKGSVVDSTGEKIGYLGEVYLDDKTGLPEWVTVAGGMFGTHASFIPLREAEIIEDQVCVRYPKDLIKHSPRVKAHDHLTPKLEDELYQHYGVENGSMGLPATGTGGEPRRPALRRTIVSDDDGGTIASSRDTETAPGQHTERNSP